MKSSIPFLPAASTSAGLIQAWIDYGFLQVASDADPFYTLTQNAFADVSYLDYLRNTYGERSKLLGRLIEARRSDSELQAWDAQWPSAVQRLDSLEINQSIRYTKPP